ncbi:hypothetical protein [Rubellicoccus peritrichatus]|uniref:Uncharacterized protein n=1 Tax=Rubellicoccus peritrichatus TaxID=3080537 RepID=A0AAQ3QWC9_9BACT|nr:hypothetical protein [Puniceicoccus sp. CR14]WOO42558.1 hypothetical protein RZN69_05605 [Puniceicoccus sp. CR14]
MTDGRFEKLVNLYLDKEISPKELSDLKAEIAHNLVRRQKFERLCRVHAASRKALISSSSKSGISSFLHEEVNTIEAKRGQRISKRKAGTPDDAIRQARNLLTRTVVACLIIMLSAGLFAAYVIDKAAEKVRDAARPDEMPGPLDTFSLTSRQDILGQADAFIVGTADTNQKRISEFFVLKVSAFDSETDINPQGVGVQSLIQWSETASPMELHQLETALQRAGYHLPGTSAPMVFPKTRPMIITVDELEAMIHGSQ